MWKHLVFMACAVVVLGGLALGLMSGPRSIFLAAQINQDKERLSLDLERVRAANEVLERKIAGLNPATLDADLLLERLHAMSLTLSDEALLYTN